MPEITPRLSAALADRYRIERHLGEGGMATVYLADDVRHDRMVALKSCEIYVEATSGESGRYQVSTSGGSSPRWSPDGRVLYFVSSGTLIAATVTTRPGFRVTSRAARFDGITDLNPINVNYDVHPNGEEFVVIDQQGAAGVTGLVWILNWLEIIREMDQRR